MAPQAQGIIATEGPEYFIGKGLSETLLDNFDEALEIFLQGFRKFPDNLEIQFFLLRTTGDTARYRNNRETIAEIIAMWDQFIAAHPDEMFSVSRGTAHAYVERGILKQALGDAGGAQKDFSLARVTDPEILVP